MRTEQRHDGHDEHMSFYAVNIERYVRALYDVTSFNTWMPDATLQAQDRGCFSLLCSRGPPGCGFDEASHRSNRQLCGITRSGRAPAAAICTKAPCPGPISNMPVIVARYVDIIVNKINENRPNQSSWLSAANELCRAAGSVKTLAAMRFRATGHLPASLMHTYITYYCGWCTATNT